MLNPKTDLQIKILVGDKSDNIPQVKPKMGPKTAEKALKDLDSLWEGENGAEYKDKYILNKQLIDLDLIPTEIQNKIKELYFENESGSFSGRKVYDFFSKRMPNGLRFIQEFNECFKQLKSHEELKQ